MGKGTTVEQDPAVGKAAEANAAVASRAQDLAEQQWNWNKSLTEKYAPLYENLINSAIASQNASTQQAQDQWKQYQDVFQPIEDQFAEQAANYNSPAEQAKREGLAAADVGAQFDAAQDQTAREMGRMGVSPTSSMGLQAITDQNNKEALAKAGAITGARNNVELTGLQALQSAAQFGRNQVGTSIAAGSAALQGGNSAAGLMADQTAQGNAAGTTQGLLGTAVAGNNSAGNMLLNQWQTQVQQQANQDSGLGSLLGTLGGAAITKWSSKKLKEDKRPVDDRQALEGLKKVPIESWKYKDGIEDGGRHTGPYAEDMHAQFGDGVAPGGAGLDMVSVSGVHHAAIRALANDMDQVKKHVGLEPVSEKKPKASKVKVQNKSKAPKLMDADLTPGLLGLE
jgi:hypothetical protein